MIYLHLYLTFFKIGLFAIGGGLVTLPFLQEVVDKYAWITSAELLNMIAISESTPGPVGINAATFMGYSRAGYLGGLIATLGMITPSIIIIIIIAHYFAKFNEEPLVEAAFKGIRPAVAALIAAAGLQVAKVALLDLEIYKGISSLLLSLRLDRTLFLIFMLYIINRYKKHPIFYIALAALLGIVFKL